MKLQFTYTFGYYVRELSGLYIWNSVPTISVMVNS